MMFLISMKLQKIVIPVTLGHHDIKGVQKKPQITLRHHTKNQAPLHDIFTLFLKMQKPVSFWEVTYKPDGFSSKVLDILHKTF